MRGAAIAWAPATAGSRRPIALQARGAPACCRASRRQRGTKKAERIRSKNPDIDYLLRGTVNDTTARRMGGVAGHAGVFSTAHDVGIYAQALLDRLAGRPSDYPLTASDAGVDDESAAARTQRGTNRGGERCRPGSRRKHDRSAAGSALSGDQGTEPARLRLGYRHGPVDAAGQALSHRELWPHGLHRHQHVDRPGLGHVRGAADEFDPHAGQSTGLEAAGRRRDGGSAGAGSV